MMQKAYQYSFDQEKIAEHDDESVPVHKRLFRGPNTWPDRDKFPDFKSVVEELTSKYMSPLSCPA